MISNIELMGSLLISMPNFDPNTAFYDEELIYRGVIASFWDEKNNRPSSAAFKDSFGCSVDRQGDRNHNDSLISIRNNLPNVEKVSYISYKDCCECSSSVHPDPTENNSYHCLIKTPDGQIPLTNSMAKQLSRKCISI